MPISHLALQVVPKRHLLRIAIVSSVLGNNREQETLFISRRIGGLWRSWSAVPVTQGSKLRFPQVPQGSHLQSLGAIPRTEAPVQMHALECGTCAVRSRQQYRATACEWHLPFPPRRLIHSKMFQCHHIAIVISGRLPCMLR